MQGQFRCPGRNSSALHPINKPKICPKANSRCCRSLREQSHPLPAGLGHHHPALDLFLLFHPSGDKPGRRRSRDLREDGNLGSSGRAAGPGRWDFTSSPFPVNNSLSWVGFAPGRARWDVGRGLGDPFSCRAGVERGWGWGWELNKGLLFPGRSQHRNEVQTNNRRLFPVLFRWNPPGPGWGRAGNS